ncbi:MAG: ABC transporter permease subunit [Dokdonella sp.]
MDLRSRIELTRRARARRERLTRVLATAGAGVVVFTLFAIPVFLAFELLPFAPWPDAIGHALGALLVGTTKATLAALLIALPLGIGAAIYNARFSALRLRNVVRPMLEIVEAFPSVVIGLVAAVWLAPWLRLHLFQVVLFVLGASLLVFAVGHILGSVRRTAAPGLERWLPFFLMPIFALLAILIGISIAPGAGVVPVTPWNSIVIGIALGFAAIPMVFSIAEDALGLVPDRIVDGALALGATRWQALRTLVLPTVAPSLLTAALLAAGRCAGETMIVLMASGNTALATFDPLVGLRTLSADIALTLPVTEPGSGAYRLLMLVTLLLFAFSFALNAGGERIRRKLRRHLSAL